MPGDTAPPTTLTAGDELWQRFRVLRPLGRGGMGIVYQVVNREVESELLAVKLLLTGVAGELGARQRLVREVAAARSLDHPHVVRVFEYYDDARRVGFSMEYLEGATLDAHLGGAVPGSPWRELAGTAAALPRVARLARQLGAALDHIHQRGLVHRDVKPSNVMLCEVPAGAGVSRTAGGAAGPGDDVHCKLMDFGVVHAIYGPQTTGEVQPGTVDFMAPELLSGTGRPSPASDIYAFGKLLYRTLTGQVPSHAVRAPSSLVDGLPTDADDVLMRCFDHADSRPRSAGDVADALDAALEAWWDAQRATEAAAVYAEVDAAVTAEPDGPRSDPATVESPGPSPRGERTGFRPEGPESAGARAGVAERRRSQGRRPLRWIGIGLAVLLVIGGLVGAAGVVVAVVLDATRPDNAVAAGIEWIAIPGGRFEMGSEYGAGDEVPVREVRVDAFEMSRSEVTVAQYRACVDAGACEVPRARAAAGEEHEQCNWGWPGRDTHPVNCATFQNAADFAEWVGGRLPTEAEWEYAARSAGRKQTYPWGDEKPTCDRVVMIDDGARRGQEKQGCRDGHSWPVCSKPLGNSAQGLCDMAGNVDEWVHDRYHETYDGAPSDAKPWLDGDSKKRVTRGGSWAWGRADQLRAAHRQDSTPSGQAISVGFRVARTP